jgi:hypothetical protein
VPVSEQTIATQVTEIMQSSDVPLPSLAQAEDFYPLTADQQTEIEARKRCALRTLARQSPLLEEEVIVEDFFSYLVAPFRDISVNTPVLRRTANLTELFKDLVKKREAAVKIVYDPVTDCVGNTCVHKSRYRWVDTITGKKGALHAQYLDKNKKT